MTHTRCDIKTQTNIKRQKAMTRKLKPCILFGLVLTFELLDMDYAVHAALEDKAVLPTRQNFGNLLNFGCKLVFPY